jgi:retinol-binding protein 3
MQLYNCIFSGRRQLTRLLPVFFVAFLLLFLSPGMLCGQPGSSDEEATIGRKIQSEIIDSVTSALNRVYVFPDMAKDMEKYVRKQLKKGEYKEFTNAFEFTGKLTEDLRSICHDKHLNVMYDPEIGIDRAIEHDSLTEEMKAQMYERMAWRNFAFDKAERLSGNIGYLKFDGFMDAEYGGPTAVAALQFLAHCDALIIDLRENGGGSPSMIQLISSYFFEESVHLNSFYIRETDTIKQFWTQSHVDGKRLTDMPLYVLTSGYTFSAAEEFTYNLKNMERATIVGETTGGGAHPVNGEHFVNLKVSMSLPFGRAINPVTGTNWEGVGVEPDIAVEADEAFDVARLTAMQRLMESTDIEPKKQALNWDIEILNAELNPITVDEALLKQYAGSYGPRQVLFENGELFYQREDRPKYRLIALSDDTFMLEGMDSFKMRFIKDDAGKVIEILGMYQGGHTDRSVRD